jgi:hypothetical protein
MGEVVTMRLLYVAVAVALLLGLWSAIPASAQTNHVTNGNFEGTWG